MMQERRDRLIAAAMYYLGLRDAGKQLEIDAYLRVVGPDLREELDWLLYELTSAEGARGTAPPAYQTPEEARSVLATVRRAWHTVRAE